MIEKKRFPPVGFYECLTGLTDAFDFIREKFFANFPLVSVT